MLSRVPATIWLVLMVLTASTQCAMACTHSACESRSSTPPCHRHSHAPAKHDAQCAQEFLVARVGNAAPSSVTLHFSPAPPAFAAILPAQQKGLIGAVDSSHEHGGPPPPLRCLASVVLRA